jgi:hypothetical protein
MAKTTTIIPAGYRLTVVTWENDADNYKTVTLEGLSESRVKFLVDLAKLFKSRNRVAGCIGNYYESSDANRSEVQSALAKVVAKHPGEFTGELVDDLDDLNDDMFELMYELGLMGGDFYTRVMESFKVEHTPVEVVLSDVTENFK